jgi:hypothetical protein
MRVVGRWETFEPCAKHHAHHLWLLNAPLWHSVHIYSGMYLRSLALRVDYMVYLMEHMDMPDMSSHCMCEIDLVVICWVLAPMALHGSDGLATSLLDPNKLNL